VVKKGNDANGQGNAQSQDIDQRKDPVLVQIADRNQQVISQHNFTII
jgi:hypothetical protein